MIIGFVGPAGAGKDAACDALVEELGYEKRSFAEPMREAMRRLNPILGVPSEWMREWPAEVRWNDLPYHEAKFSFGGEGRRLLQVLGTEIGREMFGENFWVEQAIRGISSGDPVCFSDVRFKSEAEAITLMGGHLIRIIRPDVLDLGAHSEHASETEARYILTTARVVNHDSLEAFQARCVSQVRDLVAADQAVF